MIIKRNKVTNDFGEFLYVESFEVTLPLELEYGYLMYAISELRSLN